MTCKNGHDGPWRKSGECAICLRLRDSERRARTKDERNAKKRARYAIDGRTEAEILWREQNKEKLYAKHRLWYAKNAEAQRQKKREQRAANPEIHKARLRQGYRKFRDKRLAEVKAHYLKSPASIDEARRNRRARVRGAEGKHTLADIRALLVIQKGKCVYCKADIKAGYHVDHIMPLRLGGSNDRRNLQLLCQPCNNSKWATHPVVFAQRIGLLL